MGTVVYFYLLLLSLFVMYMRRSFFSMLGGTSSSQLNSEFKELRIKAEEACEKLEEISDRRLVVAVMAFIVTLLYFLIPLIYFGTSLYLFHNPLFILLSVICICCQVCYTPSIIRFMIEIIKKSRSEKDYNQSTLLISGTFFCHGLVVAFLCTRELFSR